jgi:hypothetical protein
MTVLIHCEGPECQRAASEQEFGVNVSNLNGDVIVGWLVVTGVHSGVDHHFHNITCLSRWALDQRTAQEESS